MSDQPGPPHSDQPAPPAVLPVNYPYPPRPVPPRRSSWGRSLLLAVLVFSIGLNLLLLIVSSSSLIGLGDSDSNVVERYHAGDRNATDKIAVVHVDGVIMEGMTDFVQKEIERAARDENVKAIVLRINSPGGSITASDDLFRRFKQLRDGLVPQQMGGGKQIVVSMGALAASGGYYIAMPARYIVAERTTLTGSIGVYAAFPNISGLAEKWGVSMNVIKAGDMKDSGSIFNPMSPDERALWQDMVDHAYGQFLAVVEEGRPNLKGKLRDVIIEEMVPDIGPDGQPRLDSDGKEKMVPYIRRRADGGIFTADQAKEFGLIDSIGYLDDAVEQARKIASLGDSYKVVEYRKPETLFGSLFGAESRSNLEPQQLAEGATPRLWYLAPQSELAGVLATIRGK